MTSFLWLPRFRKAHGFASTCFSTNTTNHYAAGTHHLELLRPGESAAEVVRYLNGQCWFGDAAAVMLMTAMFARTHWKYPAPRAYRTVLLMPGMCARPFASSQRGWA